MKTARTTSICLSPSGVHTVTVEVVVRPGLPAVEVTGAPRKVSEGVSRLPTAVKACGYTWPKGKVYVHVTPQPAPDADSLDLAVTVAVLAADRQVSLPSGLVMLGRVGLTGDVKSFTHSQVLLAWCRNRQLVPLTSLTLREDWETAGVGKAHLIASLRELLNPTLCNGVGAQPAAAVQAYAIDALTGHVHAKRALAVALAGKLPLLLTGPSGVGKTALAESAAELLPYLPPEQETERLVAYALAGVPPPPSPAPVVVSAAFPCTTGQLTQRLGELKGGYLALGKTGVLFIDELGERGRDTVDSLRHVLDVSHGEPRYSQCIIAAQNTCFCGRYGDPKGTCTCSASDLARYHRVFSEAVYQRFPLSVYLPASSVHEQGMGGNRIAAQVACALQNRMALTVSAAAASMVDTVVARSGLSHRCRVNMLRVGTVIAKLDAKENVDEACIQEALSYRYRPSPV